MNEIPILFLQKSTFGLKRKNTSFIVCLELEAKRFHPSYHSSVQLTVCEYKDAMENIRGKLTDMQKKLFHNTCFGVFLDDEEQRFSVILL